MQCLTAKTTTMTLIPTPVPPVLAQTKVHITLTIISLPNAYLRPTPFRLISQPFFRTWSGQSNTGFGQDSFATDPNPSNYIASGNNPGSGGAYGH